MTQAALECCACQPTGHNVVCRPIQNCLETAWVAARCSSNHVREDMSCAVQFRTANTTTAKPGAACRYKDVYTTALAGCRHKCCSHMPQAWPAAAAAAASVLAGPQKHSSCGGGVSGICVGNQRHGQGVCKVEEGGRGSSCAAQACAACAQLHAYASWMHAAGHACDAQGTHGKLATASKRVGSAALPATHVLDAAVYATPAISACQQVICDAATPPLCCCCCATARPSASGRARRPHCQQQPRGGAAAPLAPAHLAPLKRGGPERLHGLLPDGTARRPGPGPSSQGRRRRRQWRHAASARLLRGGWWRRQ